MKTSRRTFVQPSGSLPALLGASGTFTAPASAPMPCAAPDPSVQPMPALLQPLPDAPTRKIAYAIVGLGAYALNQIIPNLSNTRHAKLSALVSGKADKAGKVAEAYGIGKDHIYSYTDFDRIAGDESVDVVYTIPPNAMHREWTERAFAAGKQVLCENPMAVTEEDCRAMIDAGKKAGKKLRIGYRARFDPHNLRATELVRGEEKSIGEPHLVFTEHGRMLKPEEETRDEWRTKKELAGGGSLYDIGTYSLNGAPPSRGRK